ncbi:MAG: type II toxin-antitoxin system VapC family toxin [Verrucomicrobiales bacterium]
MAVLVDTNVISDVMHDDPVWRPWAEAQLTAHRGDSIINPIIYAELCCRAMNTAELDLSLAMLGIGYGEVPREALFLAARAFLVYRRRGGAKASPLPDFFIGGHAEVLGVPLLTRDVDRYRAYFPNVPLLCP